MIPSFHQEDKFRIVADVFWFQMQVWKFEFCQAVWHLDEFLLKKQAKETPFSGEIFEGVEDRELSEMI